MHYRLNWPEKVCIFSLFEANALPIYRHADWDAELSNLGSSTLFQAHSSDFVTRKDNRFQRDVFGTPSNSFTSISQYFCLLFTWRTRLLSWINKILELSVECPNAELHDRHFKMQLWGISCVYFDKNGRSGQVRSQSYGVMNETISDRFFMEIVLCMQ